MLTLVKHASKSTIKFIAHEAAVRVRPKPPVRNTNQTWTLQKQLHLLTIISAYPWTYKHRAIKLDTSHLKKYKVANNVLFVNATANAILFAMILP